MSMLGFILQCAATAALLGSAAGLVTFGLVVLVRPLIERLSASVRSDLLLLMGVLPALAVIAVVAATAAPSVGSALGFGQDHCSGHSHHFHICFLHSSGVRPDLATLGSLALGAWLFRAVAMGKRLLDSRAHAGRLEKLGERRSGVFPILVIPGTRLCHATGLVRRRIMVSAEVAETLSPAELAGALAHEEEHLRRRDPLASFLLTFAAIFVPPPIGSWLKRVHRQAAEGACDAAAAATVGDGAVVAAALVKVASLQRGGGFGLDAPAFGGQALETRVRALLDGPRPEAGRSHWRLLAFAAAAGFALVAWRHAGSLHHGAETLLSRLF